MIVFFNIIHQPSFHGASVLRLVDTHGPPQKNKSFCGGHAQFAITSSTYLLHASYHGKMWRGPSSGEKGWLVGISGATEEGIFSCEPESAPNQLLANQGGRRATSRFVRHTKKRERSSSANCTTISLRDRPMSTTFFYMPEEQKLI